MDSALTPPDSRRRFSRRAFVKLAAAAGAIGAFYPFEIARHHLQVEKRNVLLPRLADEFRGMKIVQISDLHFEEFDEAFFLEHVVNVVNGLKPDMVLYTGDFVSYGPLPIDFGRSRIAPGPRCPSGR